MQLGETLNSERCRIVYRVCELPKTPLAFQGAPCPFILTYHILIPPTKRQMDKATATPFECLIINHTPRHLLHK